MYCIFVLIVIYDRQRTPYSVGVNLIYDKRSTRFNVAVMQGQFSK